MNDKLDDLANAIYAPRHDGRIEQIRRAFERWQAEGQDDVPHERPFMFMLIGVAAGAVAMLAVAMYWL